MQFLKDTIPAKQIVFLFLLALVFFSCKNNNSATDEPTKENTLFTLLPSEKTHIDFANTLTEGLNTNVLMYEYFYNGGGVAIGDVNGDGKQDVYFTGNMTDNKLYLNKGAMQFEDITTAADVAGRPGPWKTGVTMADVNGDGKIDIYVCYSGKIGPDKRKNNYLLTWATITRGCRILRMKPQILGWIFRLLVPRRIFLIMTATVIWICCWLTTTPSALAVWMIYLSAH